jgi:3-mercaptopyruvate sulfurtransferase SseA
MDNRLKYLTTSQVVNQLGNPAVKIIDVRTIDAYNGWRVKNETRGGHIKTARSLPFKWCNYLDWLDIVRSKDIEPNNSLILYGYEKEKTEHVAQCFAKAHYTDVSVYHDFVNEWCTDLELPMSYLGRYRQLVSAQWLHDLISKKNVPEYEGNKYVICHAHYRNKGAYDEGHIPGAIELDTNTLESPDTWNCRSPQELKQTLEKAGITHDTTVILYGRYSFPNNDDPFPGSSAGDLGAMRCAFLMLYAGVKDVRILNGGLQSWNDNGFQISTEDVPRKPISDFGLKIPYRPNLIVDISEAKKILQSPDKNLVCVRSWREYVGEVSGYNYIRKKGRIPGAVFVDCGSDAYHMENYRNVDLTTREYHEIKKLWAGVNITPDKHNSFYCGTGWRASEAWFNAWLMGWSNISVFDGGWFEWSNDELNPYETGLPT